MEWVVFVRVTRLLPESHLPSHHCVVNFLFNVLRRMMMIASTIAIVNDKLFRRSRNQRRTARNFHFVSNIGHSTTSPWVIVVSSLATLSLCNYLWTYQEQQQQQQRLERNTQLLVRSIIQAIEFAGFVGTRQWWWCKWACEWSVPRLCAGGPTSLSNRITTRNAMRCDALRRDAVYCRVVLCSIVSWSHQPE